MPELAQAICRGLNSAHPSYIPAGEQIANARLISLAPELLDLLTLALPCVEESEQFEKPSAPKLSKRIRATLNKLNS